MGVCAQCGWSYFDDDHARGDVVCVKCGSVAEDTNIVSEVNFVANSNGGYSLVGQFFSDDQAQPYNAALGRAGVRQNSMDRSFTCGKKLIQSIASQLNVPNHCVEMACNFLKMCLKDHLTRGRSRSHIVVACLYMTCRLENTAHLLLDFSDITQVNVFDLGRALTFVTQKLHINLPPTDPCLYILRFAISLRFGDKEKDVVSLATRLVQRMKRDWIATGRRPTGVCGAALLIAARRFNVIRTIQDIVNVVHISGGVVRKRLDEFARTASSALTVDQFNTVDLDISEYPPAFQDAHRKSLRLDEEALEKMRAEMKPVEMELETALIRKRREKFKKTPYASLVAGSFSLDTSPESAIMEHVVRDEIVDFVFTEAYRDGESAGISSSYAPTLQSLGISDPSKPSTSKESSSSVLEESEDSELDISGIVDSEIDTYILSVDEAAAKSEIWHRLNAEHLAEVEKKCQMKAAAERAEDSNENLKSRKRSVRSYARKKKEEVASTFQEAIGQVIKEKRLSRKVDYNILNSLHLVDIDEDRNKSIADDDCSLSSGTQHSEDKWNNQKSPSDSLSVSIDEDKRSTKCVLEGRFTSLNIVRKEGTSIMERLIEKKELSNETCVVGTVLSLAESDSKADRIASSGSISQDFFGVIQEGISTSMQDSEGFTNIKPKRRKTASAIKKARDPQVIEDLEKIRIALFQNTIPVDNISSVTLSPGISLTASSSLFIPDADKPPSVNISASVHSRYKRFKPVSHNKLANKTNRQVFTANMSSFKRSQDDISDTTSFTSNNVIERDDTLNVVGRSSTAFNDLKRDG